MLLSADNILNFLVSNGKGQKAQVGYDLTIQDITKIHSGVLSKNKAEIEPYSPIGWMKPEYYAGNKFKDKPLITDEWVYLDKGVYSLTFEQGVKLDNSHCGFVTHRSSVLRSGAMITSGVFDNGFACDNLGATMFVYERIVVERGSRLAQFLIFETEQTSLYDGNYQGAKDLK